jgi:hypothetical protein
MFKTKTQKFSRWYPMLGGDWEMAKRFNKILDQIEKIDDNELEIFLQVLEAEFEEIRKYLKK